MDDISLVILREISQKKYAFRYSLRDVSKLTYDQLGPRLQLLERQGLIASCWSEPEADELRSIVYKLTKAGWLALQRERGLIRLISSIFGC